MTNWYMVEWRCPHCEQVHGLCQRAQIPGPLRPAGTAAELWPDGDLPKVLAQTFKDLVWCDKVGDYVRIEGTERLMVQPAPERPPLPFG